jgi:hypothetical protein
LYSRSSSRPGLTPVCAAAANAPKMVRKCINDVFVTHMCKDVCTCMHKAEQCMCNEGLLVLCHLLLFALARSAVQHDCSRQDMARSHRWVEFTTSLGPRADAGCV